jgi:hypothetical protein
VIGCGAAITRLVTLAGTNRDTAARNLNHGAGCCQQDAGIGPLARAAGVSGCLNRQGTDILSGDLPSRFARHVDFQVSAIAAGLSLSN